MYPASVGQGPPRRARSRPQSQSRQSHIDDTLVLQPPGIKHPIRFPFPDRKLPVCATCKRNYKTRELCRTRDGHTSLPWTTTYICITLDATCINEQGKFRSDAKFNARPIASHKHYCFSQLQTVDVPICLACKEKNYTRQYCREKLKHRQLPWATAFAVLSCAENPPSVHEKDVGIGKDEDTKKKGTSEGKSQEIKLGVLSSTSHDATAKKTDGSVQDVTNVDKEEQLGPVVKREDVSISAAVVGKLHDIDQEMSTEGQFVSKSNKEEGIGDGIPKEEFEGGVIKLDKGDTSLIEHKITQNIGKNKSYPEECTTKVTITPKEAEEKENVIEEEVAEERRMNEEENSETCAVTDTTSNEIPVEEAPSIDNSSREHPAKTMPSAKQKDINVAIDPDSNVETQPITSKRSADSEASYNSPPQKARIDDADATEEKVQNIFGSIHESKTFLAVVSSTSCSYEWLNVNPDRDKSSRSFSRRPVSSPVNHPQNALPTYPYYPQLHPHHSAYYAPHQYDYTRWGCYGYPPPQSYNIPQAQPNLGHYPYYEHDGSAYPPPEHGNYHFGSTPPQHPGNYGSSISYSEPPHPQYFAHPQSSVTQHNVYPTQQEEVSHDTIYRERSQDQYQSQVAQPRNDQQSFPEGTSNISSQQQHQLQDQLRQSPPSPQDQGSYYYPSYSNRTRDGGDHWQR